MIRVSMNDAVILERCKRLANHAMWTVKLQWRRVRGKEPEDSEFVFRWWADLQFFILSLYRLRTAAKIALNVSDKEISSRIATAIKEFDRQVPELKKLRDIGEHIDSYAIDSPKRQRKDIDRKQLEVGSWDGAVYKWLGTSLNVDDAKNAAVSLFMTLLDTYQSIRQAH